MMAHLLGKRFFIGNRGLHLSPRKIGFPRPLSAQPAVSAAESARPPPPPPPVPPTRHEQGTRGQVPKLVEIPKLPLVGSMIPFHSGLKMDLRDMNGSFRRMNATYGDFYSLGMPGVGPGWCGTVYMTNDPGEMVKVLRQEGTYPSGAVENQWLFRWWVQSRNFKVAGFYGRGPEWKRVRSFLQKDMLSPQSAREYAPAMLRATAKASPRAAEWAERGEILKYLHRCALDLFGAVHFGAHDEMSEEDHERFCEAAVDSLKLGTTLNRDPLARVACLLGIQTPAIRRFFRAMDATHEISVRRQKRALDRIRSTGGGPQQLSAEDRDSYFYKSLLRLEESHDVTLDELMEIGQIIMAASVDTTSSKTAWNVLQLALNPDAQERLRSEVLQAIAKEQEVTGGTGSPSLLTPAVLDTPYLKAFIRETHRCTPVAPFTMSKELAAPTEIHGVELPAGSLVAFEGHSPQFDPGLLGDGHDPMEFRPERWLPGAVEARKGTAAARLDHPFFSGPFSQGARRCPGSRVAYLEVQAMLARLVVDWRVEGPPAHWSEVPSAVETLVVPVFPEGVRFVPSAP